MFNFEKSENTTDKGILPSPIEAVRSVCAKKEKFLFKLQFFKKDELGNIDYSEDHVLEEHKYVATHHNVAALVAYAYGLEHSYDSNFVKFICALDKDGVPIKPEIRCKYCGKTIEEDSKFCRHCGMEQ